MFTDEKYPAMCNWGLKSKTFGEISSRFIKQSESGQRTNTSKIYVNICKSRLSGQKIFRLERNALHPHTKCFNTKLCYL